MMISGGIFFGMKRIFSVLLLAIATLSAGCSDIGKINGVDVSRVAGENPNASLLPAQPRHLHYRRRNRRWRNRSHHPSRNQKQQHASPPPLTR